MSDAWLLLIPPLVTLAIAVTTRRAVLSLLCGCILAGWILSDFSLGEGILLFGTKFLSTSQFDQWTSLSGVLNAPNPQICFFVIVTGILICTIERTGGYKAFNETLERYVHQKQQAELAAVALSHCVSLDGYLSTLTVGSVMRPLIDKYQSRRVKLAFIARFLAIPICSINPFSTWMALILLQLNIAGIHPHGAETSVISIDPFSVYFMVIPYMFYSILSLFTVWFVVSKQISFGTMGQLEHSAEKIKHKRGPYDKSINPKYIPRLFDFFSPILASILFTALAFLYTGGWWLFGGERGILEAMEHINVAPSLLFGSCAATLFYLIYMSFRGALKLKDWWPLVKEGAATMFAPLLVLNLAWTFGALEIQSDIVHRILQNMIPQDVEFIWIPLIFFIGAIFTSTAIGSSWATIGLLFPIVTATITSMESHPIPFELYEVPLLLPSLGAVVSGAVAGDQLSPISDTSFVVSASTQCIHGDHVQSQFTYGIPLVVCTCAAYALAGWLSVVSPLMAATLPVIFSALMAAIYFLLRNKYSRYRFASNTTLSWYFVLIFCPMPLSFLMLRCGMVHYAALVVLGTMIGVGCKFWHKKRSKPAIPTAQMAVGKAALVYKKIPRHGAGIVSVAINEKLVQFTAESHDGMAIPTFTPVQVVAFIDSATVSVAPVTLLSYSDTH